MRRGRGRPSLAGKSDSEPGGGMGTIAVDEQAKLKQSAS